MKISRREIVKGSLSALGFLALDGLPVFAAVGFAFAFAAQVGASETAWIDESIATAGDTGEWSRDVLYERATGRATLDGEYVFTPNTPSAGKYVTLKVAMSFTRDKDETALDAGVQGAVRLGVNGFQVWAGSWLDVAAAGVTPVAGREYELSFVFDYAARRYSVSVLDAKGAWRRLEAAGGAQAFPIAAKADKVSSVTLDGDTRFHYLKGSQTDVVLSRAETRRRGAVGDPIGNAAAVPAQVFDANRISAGTIEQSFDANRIPTRSIEQSFDANRNQTGSNECRLMPLESGWRQSKRFLAETKIKRSKNGY